MDMKKVERALFEVAVDSVVGQGGSGGSLVGRDDEPTIDEDTITQRVAEVRRRGWQQGAEYEKEVAEYRESLREGLL